ncbi:unnamed protein product [Hymenolepis diminuta]|uniref:Transposase n=1 Tax=Hymenolepis diminuta TaxID=6216 RepID=A0A0R3S7L1_HYMDI|nr:unnamed protein product [Hymenolepis diminuta]
MPASYIEPDSPRSHAMATSGNPMDLVTCRFRVHRVLRANPFVPLPVKRKVKKIRQNAKERFTESRKREDYRGGTADFLVGIQINFVAYVRTKIPG